MEMFSLHQESGLLPRDVTTLGLRALEGGWQAFCESGAGPTHRFEFPADELAQRRMAERLETELSFSAWTAHEATRRLFEPFLLDAAW